MSSSSRRAPLRNVPPPAGGTAKPATAYARFIPREELSSFAAWSPQALSGAPAPNAALRRATDHPPETPAADEVAAQLRAARQSGYHDGYRDGLVALEGFKQSYAGQVTLSMDVLAAAFRQQLDALQQEIAQAVAAAAESVARQVVRSEIAARPEAIAAVAQEAVDTLLASARHITLRLHPDDQALVAAGAGEALAARGVRLVADPALTRGGCVAEADIGAVDATLETRWQHAVAAIGRASAWADDAAAPGNDA